MKLRQAILLLLFLCPCVCDCRDKPVDRAIIERVSQLANRLKRTPKDWDIRVLSEQEWRHLLKRLNPLDPFAKKDVAFTLVKGNQVTNVTILRGRRVDSLPDDTVLLVLAHEDAHILCGCDSEHDADLLARELMPIAKAEGGKTP